jgi:hypothetical protein
LPVEYLLKSAFIFVCIIHENLAGLSVSIVFVQKKPKFPIKSLIINNLNSDFLSHHTFSRNFFFGIGAEKNQKFTSFFCHEKHFPGTFSKKRKIVSGIGGIFVFVRPGLLSQGYWLLHIGAVSFFEKVQMLLESGTSQRINF